MKAHHRGMIVFCIAGAIIGFTTGNAIKHDVVKIKKVTTVKTYIPGSKEFARNLLKPDQYKCFDYILTKESHWNPKAVEPSTFAYGVGQLLPSTWFNIGYLKTSNANAQVIATLVYIARHYGTSSNSVCIAADHSKRYGSY